MILTTSLTMQAQASTPVKINQVTQATYREFLNQFSESCRSHAQTVLMQVSLATNLFNRQQYDDAALIFERRVDGSILQLMQSEDCTIEDSILMLEQSALLRPLEDNIFCLMRVVEAEDDFITAADHLEREELKESYGLVGQSTFTLKGLIETQLCQHLPMKFQDKVLATYALYESVERQLKEILEMPRENL